MSRPEPQPQRRAYVRTFELAPALPEGLLERLRDEAPRKPNFDSRSFWLDLHRAAAAGPRNAGEQLALWVARHVPVWGGAGADTAGGPPRIAGLEYWCHARPASQGMPFHFDKDEGRLGRSLAPCRSDLVHPILSSVFYVDCTGGPTIVVDQRVHPQDLYRLEPEAGPSAAAVCFPGAGRLLVFDGSLLHGVRGDPGAAGDGADSGRAAHDDGNCAGEAPDAQADQGRWRFTFMMNFWVQRPLDPTCVEAGPEDHLRFGGPPVAAVAAAAAAAGQPRLAADPQPCLPPPPIGVLERRVVWVTEDLHELYQYEHPSRPPLPSPAEAPATPCSEHPGHRDEQPSRSSVIQPHPHIPFI